jgi:hypothetical protein
MSEPPWSTLSEPFPPGTVRWHAVEASPDGLRVRLSPHLAPEALGARLDAVVGPDGWGLDLRPWGEDRLIAELTVRGASRATVVRVAPLPGLGDGEAHLDAGAAATGAAMSSAARLFGVLVPVRTIGDGWVDADPDTGEALHPPEHGAEAPSARPGAARDGATSDRGAAAEAAPAETEPVAAKPDGHQVIDRLVERLREEGMGGDAARLVTAYGGYGRDPDASRELYAKLRALLVERGGRG